MSTDLAWPVSDLLDASIHLAERAGRIALDARTGITGELKEDLTYVTDVDRRVELYLRDELSRLTPGVGFLGEEFGSQGDTSRLAWIIDPIDGTNNLLFGLPSWGISIGLAHDGRSILGVYHLPVTRETFSAREGGGARMNGAPIRARDRTPLHHQDCLGVTSLAARRFDLGRTVGWLRLLGSIGTEIAYSADGRLYACISYGDKLVDLGAVECIARESGCDLEYLGGDPFRLQEWIDGPPRDEPLLIGPAWAVRELRDALTPPGE